MVYDEDENPRRNRNRSWWEQRTNMERYVIVALIIAALIILGLIIAIAVISHKNKTASGKSGSDSVCLTSDCVNTANQILRHVDASKDPCDDFYEFACGGFLKDTVIPPDKSEVDQFSILGDKVQQQIQSLFGEPIKSNEIHPFRTVKELYKICLNTSSIEHDGLTPAYKLFQNLGGWPALERDQWKEHEFDWVQSSKVHRKYGLSLGNFISIGVATDSKNSSRMLFNLDQPTLDIPRDNLLGRLNDPVTKAYYDYMIDLSVLFGIDRNFAENEVRNMLDFKTKIAEISLSEQARQNPDTIYNPMTVAELQRRHPSIKMLELINGLIGRSELAISSGQLINVKVPQYISNVEQLLNRTPKRVQANYAMYTAVASIISFLPEQMRRRELQYMGATSGVSVREPRNSECISNIQNLVSIAAGALYARTYFQEETRIAAREIISDLRNEFIEVIKDVKWMDAETRKKAIDKANAIVQHIGYPDEFLDDNKLEEYYRGLRLSSENYMNSMLEVLLFQVDKSLEQVNIPVNKTDWRTRSSVVQVNAGYSPNENSIQLSAAILQGIFFNKDRPQYMNFGAIAFVIGHEITHGFDSQGKRFDKHGNLVDWWSPEVAKAYDEKAKCIIDQYSAFTVPETGTKLNGELTVNENIADNGGIKEAYLAYNRWVKKNGEEPTLPGLNYTAKQAFWISAANGWCTKPRKESIAKDLLTDVHSPGRFRVIGPFSNSEDFAKDFNCPAGSKMNPKQKCAVW